MTDDSKPNLLGFSDPVKLFLNHPESSPKMVSETTTNDKRKDNSSEYYEGKH